MCTTCMRDQVECEHRQHLEDILSQQREQRLDSYKLVQESIRICILNEFKFFSVRRTSELFLYFQVSFEGMINQDTKILHGGLRRPCWL